MIKEFSIHPDDSDFKSYSSSEAGDNLLRVMVADKIIQPMAKGSKEFKSKVVDYFISEYDNGRTPNPCVVCNKKIKFGWMLEQAKKLGCNYVATGHYARIEQEIPKNKLQITNPSNLLGTGKSQITNSKLSNNRLSSKVYSLFCAKDKKKDQSYFLWQLDQEQLSHILFPIGEYTKEEVRALAKKWKLSTANKQESQDLCFINTDKADFLANYAIKLNKSGIIVDIFHISHRSNHLPHTESTQS